MRLRLALIHNEHVAQRPEVTPLANDQPFSFTDSIREARQRVASELRAQADQIQKLNLELTELQQLHDRTEHEANRQWDEIARVAADVNSAALAAAATGAQASAQTALENVLGAVRALMTCTIPEQVLTVLTEEASQWGVRAAIFDVRGKAAWGASAHGFGPALSEKVMHGLIVPLNQDNPFRKVCETAARVDASADTLKKNRNVLDKFKPAPQAPILLVPIRSAGAVAAIFYADPGEKDDPLPVNALMILAEFAGAQIDRLIALSGGFSNDEAGALVEEPSAHEAPAEEPVMEVVAKEPTEHPVLEIVRAEPPAEEQAEPPAVQSAAVETPSDDNVRAEELAAEPAAVEPHSQEPVRTEPLDAAPAVEEPPVDVPVVGEMQGEVHTAIAEPLAIEAASPSPERESAPPPADVPLASPEPVAATAESEAGHPVAAERHFGEVAPPMPPESPVMAMESAQPHASAGADILELSEAEQKLHKDAKRFAKLLVSEIELYNKTKVADGRANGDLYKRLKNDIDRSRQTFDKRFGKTLSKQFDYFHEELVKNLAANDSSVLGPEYPGPPA